MSYEMWKHFFNFSQQKIWKHFCGYTDIFMKSLRNVAKCKLICICMIQIKWFSCPTLASQGAQSQYQCNHWKMVYVFIEISLKYGKKCCVLNLSTLCLTGSWFASFFSIGYLALLTQSCSLTFKNKQTTSKTFSGLIISPRVYIILEPSFHSFILSIHIYWAHTTYHVFW